MTRTLYDALPATLPRDPDKLRMEIWAVEQEIADAERVGDKTLADGLREVLIKLEERLR